MFWYSDLALRKHCQNGWWDSPLKARFDEFAEFIYTSPVPGMNLVDPRPPPPAEGRLPAAVVPPPQLPMFYVAPHNRPRLRQVDPLSFAEFNSE